MISTNPESGSSLLDLGNGKLLQRRSLPSLWSHVLSGRYPSPGQGYPSPGQGTPWPGLGYPPPPTGHATGYGTVGMSLAFSHRRTFLLRLQYTLLMRCDLKALSKHRVIHHQAVLLSSLTQLNCGQ